MTLLTIIFDPDHHMNLVKEPKVPIRQIKVTMRINVLGKLSFWLPYDGYEGHKNVIF